MISKVADIDIEVAFSELTKTGRLKKLKLPRKLDKRAMAKSDGVWLADPADPAFIHRKPKKVLTNISQKPKVKSAIQKLIRKDDKMATKLKTQINYTQRIAVCLLAGGAVLGFADQLGGGLKACAVAALLVGCLFVMAIDFKK